MTILDALPERGWGVVRADPRVVLAYLAAGLIKAQHAGPSVFHCRLTGAGRLLRGEQP